MNDSENPKPDHRAYLSLGSNIDPEQNMRKALRLLHRQAHLLAISTCWETEAVGRGSTPDTRYPNFLNLAACIATPLEPEALKTELTRPIENALGRVRTADKYAPRTIDLDLIVFDDQILEPDLWKRPFLALTLAELLPYLTNAQTGETLSEAASRLSKGHLAVARGKFDSTG